MSKEGGSNIFRNSIIKKNLTTAFDQDGRVIDIDVREDEEQNIKFLEIIELLLAAGYFRARIKGLSAFDKVVGGISWCITTCNVDLDVDILFQENSTIGQKIALVEKIVSVLPKMNCPFRIEPHQIQGLDFIHIFPVIQWLVKKAIEKKEETGDSLREYSISQFKKFYKEIEVNYEKRLKIANESMENYKPKRIYRRKRGMKLHDLETEVRYTLMEYGQFGFPVLNHSTSQRSNEQLDKKKINNDVLQTDSLTNEEDQVKSLLDHLSIMESKNKVKLSAQFVGNLISGQSEEIGKIAIEYKDKKTELISLKSGEVSMEDKKKRLISKTKRQIDIASDNFKKLQLKFNEMKNTYDRGIEQFEENVEKKKRLEEESKSIEEIENGSDSKTFKILSDLVSTEMNISSEIDNFRKLQQEEIANLKKEISEILNTCANVDDEQEKERCQLICKQIDVKNNKLQKERLKLAKISQDISMLQRKLDEAPSRAELSQYQQRFVELYNQISTKHKETKQFFTLYNTLNETKQHLNKEINLLNSIYDSFEKARLNPMMRDQFLKQFENIVDGIKQARLKIERVREEEKLKRDRLNNIYSDLIEKDRTYFKLVKDFQDECRKNEILMTKLK